MTDELKQGILQLLKDRLIIKVDRERDYYGSYTTTIGLYLWDGYEAELISESYAYC